MNKPQKIFLAVSVAIVATYGGFVAYRLYRRSQTDKSVVTPEQAMAIINANAS